VRGGKNKVFTNLKKIFYPKAEILVYYGKFEEAEEVYSKMERKDLAIQMRMRMGDWNRVLALTKEVV
jgi:pentatricopeptide repeat protein